MLRNGHLNTIYPTLFRRQKSPAYERVRVTTLDDDFLHVDCILQNHKRLAILCHGLEGTSLSKYIIGTGDILSQQGWDIAAINYRGCSGEQNLNPILYHSGATEDLHDVVQWFAGDYDEISLVGFSLGGNLVLKYCGEKKRSLSDNIRSAIALSVPVDLAEGSQTISQLKNYIYQKKFLISLSKKVIAKSKQFPDIVDASLLRKIRTLYDFDDVYTSKLHGFEDAEDYYKISSSKQFLRHIDIPALIINALDDPFLPEACYPYHEVKGNKSLSMITPSYGGPVGFTTPGEAHYWDEVVVSNFLGKHSHL